MGQRRIQVTSVLLPSYLIKSFSRVRVNPQEYEAAVRLAAPQLPSAWVPLLAQKLQEAPVSRCVYWHMCVSVKWHGFSPLLARKLKEAPASKCVVRRSCWRS